MFAFETAKDKLCKVLNEPTLPRAAPQYTGIVLPDLSSPTRWLASAYLCPGAVRDAVV